MKKQRGSIWISIYLCDTSKISYEPGVEFSVHCSFMIFQPAWQITKTATILPALNE